MISRIASQRIILQRCRQEHVHVVYHAIKNSYAEIEPWLGWLTPAYNENSAQEFINLQINNWNNGIEYTYIIKNKTDDLLGIIGLHLYDVLNDVASIGYWMNSKYTGMGYCTEAVKLLVEHVLKPLNLIRIEIIVASNNIASQKVALKSGAQFEGLLRNRIRIRGVAEDANMYAIIAA
jgi:RimJ/RimL family protein N-acetyltransferase